MYNQKKLITFKVTLDVPVKSYWRPHCWPKYWPLHYNNHWSLKFINQVSYLIRMVIVDISTISKCKEQYPMSLAVIYSCQSILQITPHGLRRTNHRTVLLYNYFIYRREQYHKAPSSVFISLSVFILWEPSEASIQVTWPLRANQRPVF